jgi:starvation-inducible outer membrane lipoprotein
MTIKSVILAALVLALAGCTSIPPGTAKVSACSVSEASMECQVERYNNVNAD